MQHKQCLFFVAKCLTPDQQPERIAELIDAIDAGAVDWEDAVRLSSGQLVLPAFFLQLKRKNLLSYLPGELVDHLEAITDLNRQRNLAILDQAKSITAILNKKNITPVFLKGVAHLLVGIYQDNAERLIGDIDFLVPREQLVTAAELLMAEGYKPFSAYDPGKIHELKNYPRLHRADDPAPVEIHQELLHMHDRKLLRGANLLKGKVPVENMEGEAFVPSIQKMIIHNVFNVQSNDNAYRNCTIFIRQMYDLQLLSLKEDSYVVARNYGKHFRIFNAYFAAISYVFSSPCGIRFRKTIRARFYIKKMAYFLTHYRAHQLYRKTKYLSARVKRYILVLTGAIFNKHTRLYLFKRLKSRSFYQAQIRSWTRDF